jgi:hypothetical protein
MVTVWKSDDLAINIPKVIEVNHIFSKFVISFIGIAEANPDESKYDRYIDKRDESTYKLPVHRNNSLVKTWK